MLSIRVQFERARGRSVLGQHLGALTAEEALDQGATEGPDVVGARAWAARVADDMGFGLEGMVAYDLQEQLLVAAERQAGGGMTPLIELWRQSDSPTNDHGGRDGEDGCPSV